MLQGAVLGVVAAVVVGGPFGTASIEVAGSSDGVMEFEVSVEGPRATPVVVHAVDPGGDQVTTALVEGSPGVHSGRFEARPADLLLVFENVTTGEQAEPVSLTALGVDPGALAPAGRTTTTAAPPGQGDSVRWGWLALALGLGSLSLVALWALGADETRPAGRPRPEREAPEPKPVGEPPDEG